MPSQDGHISHATEVKTQHRGVRKLQQGEEASLAKTCARRERWKTEVKPPLKRLVKTTTM